MSTESSGPPWDKAVAAYRKTYDEVLLAIKHQDDKLGRILAALAFLTAAGGTLFREFRGMHAPFTPNLWSYLLIAFLVNSALALFFALAAIYPGTFAPGFLDNERRTLPRQLLFYGAIAKDAQWRDRVADDLEHLDEHLARNLYDDAWLLANHVVYKVRRSEEAAAFLYVAISCLVLFGVFALPVGGRTAWGLATAFLTAVTALPLMTYVVPQDRTPRRRSTVIFVVCVFGVVAAMVTLSALHHEAFGLAAGLVILLAARLENDLRSIVRL